ncbi:metalloregulator ArsR/SmtB family transcription factor [bacterium]|nr:metalloregulator ArsR/SmtB family transcription factor [bacterium]
MTIKKSGYFEEISVRMTEFAKALAHPARLEILETLAQKDHCNCGEIVSKLPLAQSTVSQHLRELKNSGIISSENEGSKSQYAIEWLELESHFQALGKFADKLKTLKNIHKPQIL